MPVMIRRSCSDVEVFRDRSTQSSKKTFVCLFFSNRLKFIIMPLCLGLLFFSGELTAGTVCRKASVVDQLAALNRLEMAMQFGSYSTANEKKESEKRKIKILYEV